MQRAVIYSIALAIIAAGFSIAACSLARAHYDGPIPVGAPDAAWWGARHSSGGNFCCDQGDGHRVEDPDWRANDDGTYSVHVDGKWRTIDPRAVVTATNKAGFAVVWKFGDYIPCFMPGAEG